MTRRTTCKPVNRTSSILCSGDQPEQTINLSEKHHLKTPVKKPLLMSNCQKQRLAKAPTVILSGYHDLLIGQATRSDPVGSSCILSSTVRIQYHTLLAQKNSLLTSFNGNIGLSHRYQSAVPAFQEILSFWGSRRLFFEKQNNAVRSPTCVRLQEDRFRPKDRSTR